MQVVYTVPYRPNRFLAFMMRWLLRIMILGSIVFTTVQFVRALHHVREHPVHSHGRTVPKPIITPWPR